MSSSPEPPAVNASASDELTGLLWPKTFKSAYLVVMASFVLWLALLIALTECCK